MIVVENLTATLSSGKNILDKISFSLPKGSKLAIIGANGSGKSTLLRALLGLIPAGFTTYNLFGTSFLNLSLRERAKMMSYISQQQVPEGDITAWQWCELGRYIYHDSQQVNRMIIEKSLKASDALQFATRTLLSLSGGERQRVYMAGALAQETPIIMLDEVNAALDPKHREALKQLMIKQVEKTIISITHDLNSLDCYTHLLALKAGKLAAFGEINTVLTPVLLAELFDYQFQMVSHNGQIRYF